MPNTQAGLMELDTLTRHLAQAENRISRFLSRLPREKRKPWIVRVRYRSRWQDGIVQKRSGRRYYVQLLTARQYAWIQAPNILPHAYTYAPGENIKTAVRVRDFPTSAQKYSILVYGFSSGSSSLPKGVETQVVNFMKSKIHGDQGGTTIHWTARGLTDLVGKVQQNERLAKRRQAAVSEITNSAIVSFLYDCATPPIFKRVANVGHDKHVAAELAMKRGTPQGRALWRSALITFEIIPRFTHAGGVRKAIGQQKFDGLSPGWKKQKKNSAATQMKAARDALIWLDDRNKVPSHRRKEAALLQLMLKTSRGHQNDKFLDALRADLYDRNGHHRAGEAPDRYLNNKGLSCWDTLAGDMSNLSVDGQRRQALKTLTSIIKKTLKGFTDARRGDIAQEGSGGYSALRRWMNLRRSSSDVYSIALKGEPQ